jgi:hypothetical protein
VGSGSWAEARETAAETTRETAGDTAGETAGENVTVFSALTRFVKFGLMLTK